MVYGCSDTSVASTGNSFAEVLKTTRNSTLVVFDVKLPNKPIPIEVDETVIDSSNGTMIRI